MPSFTATFPNVLANGLMIQINIGYPRYVRDSMQKTSIQPLGPFQYNAIFDTGASMTFISPRVAKQLGLIQRGTAPMFTAGHPQLSALYDVYIDFVKVFGGEPIVFDPIRVMEAPLVGQPNIDCLIGRDILSRGVLIYIGYNNTFSFSI